MPRYRHSYKFDPSYGFSRDQLLAVEAPPEPADFAEFWLARRRKIQDLSARPVLEQNAKLTHAPWRVFDLRFDSTDGVTLGGWLTVPESGVIKRGLIFGHGYGGNLGPVLDLPFDDAVMMFPSLRGIPPSRLPGVPENAEGHVLHGIEDRDRYIHGSCVEDLWMCVTALQELFPEVEGHVGYLGISFGGGIGMMALPWEPRISRAHVNVPSFGNHPYRITVPSHGSGEAVRKYARKNPEAVLGTLAYFDAAVAARRVEQPVLVAPALFDPFVTPPGQFAIYNAMPPPKELFVLDAGHFEYPDKTAREKRLISELHAFFTPL